MQTNNLFEPDNDANQQKPAVNNELEALKKWLIDHTEFNLDSNDPELLEFVRKIVIENQDGNMHIMMHHAKKKEHVEYVKNLVNTYQSSFGKEFSLENTKFFNPSYPDDTLDNSEVTPADEVNKSSIFEGEETHFPQNDLVNSFDAPSFAPIQQEIAPEALETNEMEAKDNQPLTRSSGFYDFFKEASKIITKPIKAPIDITNKSIANLSKWRETRNENAVTQAASLGNKIIENINSFKETEGKLMTQSILNNGLNNQINLDLFNKQLENDEFKRKLKFIEEQIDEYNQVVSRAVDLNSRKLGDVNNNTLDQLHSLTNKIKDASTSVPSSTFNIDQKSMEDRVNRIQEFIDRLIEKFKKVFAPRNTHTAGA